MCLSGAPCNTCSKGKLKDGAEIIEINGRVVGGEVLKDVSF